MEIAFLPQFLLALLLSTAQAQEYEISSDTATSGGAPDLCELAAPQIIYHEDGNTVNLNVGDITGNIEKDQKLWIGYAQKYTAFSYVGCLLRGNRETNGLVEKDPGQCFSLCNSTIFGIEGNNCYCFGSLPSPMGSEMCTSQCAFPERTLCGKPSEAISIYMTDTNGNMADGRDRFCRAFNSAKDTFLWATCSSNLRVLCQKVAFPGFDGVVRYNDEKHWQNRNKRCFTGNVFPAMESTRIDNTTLGSRIYWIGKIRSYANFARRDVPPDAIGFRQGYVQYDGSKFLLKFAKQTASLSAVCQRVPTTTATITTTITSTTTTTTTTAATTTISQPTTTTQTGSSQIAPHVTPASQSDDKQQNNALVGVYAGLPILLVIVAVIVLVIVIRRRRMAKGEKANTVEYHGRDHNQVNIRNAAENSAYNNRGFNEYETTDGTRHDYFTLEPDYKAENYTNEDTVKDRGGDAYVYDISNSYRKEEPAGVGNTTGNMYNTFREATDDTYNHTGTLAATEDDTYDHTGDGRTGAATLSKSQSENVYSHTNQDMNTYSHTGDAYFDNDTGTDDTYDHTGAYPNKNTNNTTDTLSKSKNGVQDQDHVYSNTDQDDDTYNHLGDTNNDNYTDTDNAYYNITNDMCDATQVANDYTYAQPVGKREVQTPGQAKPVMFKHSQLPNEGDYEFARETEPTGNYELAKPPEN